MIFSLVKATLNPPYLELLERIILDVCSRTTSEYFQFLQ